MDSDDELIDIAIAGASNNTEDVDISDELLESEPEPIPDLPEGKDCHLFVSYSTEDSERVWQIVESIEKRFQLKCIYADRDFQPGMDISQNIKDGMQRSWKVLLMLSPNFTRSGWCKYEREFAFVTSMESGLNCIVPVMLEECEVPPTLVTITYIDATQPYCDVPSKVALAMSQTDLSNYMLPFDSTKKYENGFVVDIRAKREPLCYCRPAKYQFTLQQRDIDAIREGKIKIPTQLLKEAVYLLNHSRAVRHYDYSSSRKKLCCWSLFLFALLLVVSILIGLQVWMTDDSDSLAFFVFVTPALIIFVPICVYCIPCICQRQKIYKDLHSRMWKKVSRRCLKNNSILLFSAAIDKPPTLSVMRYNISQCQGFLSCIIRSRSTANAERDIKKEAFELIEEYLDTVTPVMIMKYDQLQDAPYNRHNVRKGKACICQCIERTIDIQGSISRSVF